MPSSYTLGHHFESFVKGQLAAVATAAPARSSATRCVSWKNARSAGLPCIRRSWTVSPIHRPGAFVTSMRFSTRWRRRSTRSPNATLEGKYHSPGRGRASKDRPVHREGQQANSAFLHARTASEGQGAGRYAACLPTGPEIRTAWHSTASAW